MKGHPMFFYWFPFISRRKLITSLYWGLLGRFPDHEGMAHYMKRLKSGATPEDIIREINNSDEFKARHQPKPADVPDGYVLASGVGIFETWTEVPKERLQ